MTTLTSNPAHAWPDTPAEHTPHVRHTDAAIAAPGAGTISFRNVGKTYRAAAGDVHALQDIDLDIPAGGIFGIIGRSGAGKSSLLRTINGLEKPTSGQVLVDGVDVGTLGTAALVGLRRRIGMIFQHFNLLSAKTVWDNVALPLKVAGIPPAEIAERVDTLLALVGLQGKEHVYPRRLSGGQKQRVGIARALVHRPEILLCDEATSALDPETTDAILALLRDINRRLGLTIVLITHEMGVIRDICDNVLVLEAGRIAEQGPVWRVFGDPQHDATCALLEPLRGGLPEDVAARLQPVPPARAPFEQLIELGYTGTAPVPELAQIAQALRHPTRLLRADLDRIQGRTQGRLLIAAASGTLSPDTLATLQLSQHTRSLGYVAAHD